MRTTRAVLTLLATVTLAGCSARRPPATVPTAYPFSEARAMTLMPIVDARSGEKTRVDLEKLQAQAEKQLAGKNYRVTLGRAEAALENLNVDDIAELTPDLVRETAPSERRWVMILCLEDVATKLTFGSTGNAEMTGFLFDKQTGKLAWRNKGIGKAGQGGLVGMMMKGTMKGEALSAALTNLLLAVPGQPEPVE